MEVLRPSETQAGRLGAAKTQLLQLQGFRQSEQARLRGVAERHQILNALRPWSGAWAGDLIEGLVSCALLVSLQWLFEGAWNRIDKDNTRDKT